MRKDKDQQEGNSLDIAARGPVRGIDGIKVMFATAKHDRILYFWAVVGAAAAGILTVGVARVVGALLENIIDPAITSKQIAGAELWTVIWQSAAVTFALMGAIVLRRLAASLVKANLDRRTRYQLIDAYGHAPISWHDEHPQGVLLANANSDAERAWSLFNPLPMFLGTLVMIVVALISLASVSWQMAAAGLVLFPSIAAVNSIFLRMAGPRESIAAQARAQVSQVAAESFSGAVVISALGRGAAETQRFSQYAHRQRDANIRVGHLNGGFNAVRESISPLGSLLLLGLGAWLYSESLVSIAQVVEVLYLFALIEMPIRALGWLVFAIPGSVIGQRRINAALAAPQEQLSVPVGSALSDDHGGPATITIAGLRYRYQQTNKATLQGVDLTIPAGSRLALVGATGSGKSTLVQAIAGLLPFSTGDITIADTHGRNARHRLALAPQETILFRDTVRANVLFGREASPAEIGEALQLAGVDFLDPHLGAETLLDEKGMNLSGGQRQRISLARALLGSPAAIILDDATSALDPEVEAAVLARIAQASTPATVMLIAHRPSVIAAADLVAFLQEGRIAAVGKHEDLLHRVPAYRDTVAAYGRQ